MSINIHEIKLYQRCIQSSDAYMSLISIIGALITYRGFVPVSFSIMDKMVNTSKSNEMKIILRSM